MTWQDIDLASGKMTVRAPKTEHHEGKEFRVVPVFPELRSILEEAHELAPEGAVHVIDSRYKSEADSANGWRNTNLRTQFLRILRRAKVPPWPRLFHNMRASRQTELAAEHPAHVVCDWLGNSVAIAAKHYLQTRESDFEKAINPSVTKNVTTSVTKNAPQEAANLGALVQDWTQNLTESGVMPEFASACSREQREKAEGMGLEPTTGCPAPQFQ